MAQRGIFDDVGEGLQRVLASLPPIAPKRRGAVEIEVILDDLGAPRSCDNDTRAAAAMYDSARPLHVLQGWAVKSAVEMAVHDGKMDVLPSLLDITEQEIHDESKTRFFIKAVTVLQVFWVCLQVIVRAVSGLAISQLELMAAAFAACSLVSYVFLTPKPQGVNISMRPIPVSGELTSVPNGAEWVSLRGLAVPGLEFKNQF